MVYFTSDLHFGHSGIITMQNRPFSNTAEMNRILLRNYNALIHKDDTVYILGDICHHLSLEEANNIIGKMNGKKILIRRNHDKKYDEKLFDEICDFKTVSLNGRYFALMHYPMLSWPKKNSGSMDIMLPSVQEQNEIVRILDEFFAKEAEAKEKADATLEAIGTMKKSILAKAFRGELGTNNPEDESAEELLKRTLA